MRDREIVGLHQAYLDVYSNLNYNSEAGIRAVKHVKTHGMKSLANSFDPFDTILEYLVAEGYADSYEEAEYIIEDLSDEEFEELCEKKLAHSFPLKPKDRRSAENIGRMNAGDFSVPPEEENVRVSSARKVKPSPSRSASIKKPEKPPRRLGVQNVQYNEFDPFDAILEHLVAEGYADTNESALAIMANMSEEWRQSIVEAPGEWFGGLRDRARASRAAQMQSSQPTPKPLPSSSSPFAKPASRNDSGKLTTYGAGGGAAAERAGQTRTQVMQQGAKNLENKKSKPVNQGPDFGR